MSVNEFVPEKTALEIENLWVQAYSPGSNSDEVEVTILKMVQELAHLLMSPNGQFKAPAPDIMSAFRYQCEKAAERAHEEENILMDRKAGYAHCEVWERHDRHNWLEADGTTWECSGMARR